MLLSLPTCSTQPIPLPKAPSPHATCRFKHVDGTLCSKEASNGERSVEIDERSRFKGHPFPRLCSEHIKFPEQLKAMLGLSPIKTKDSVTIKSNPRNILKSLSDTPTPVKSAHVVTTTCLNTPEPNSHSATSDPSLTTPTSSISVISILSNESFNETREQNEEQKTASKVIDSSNSTKEKDSNPLVKNTLVVPDLSAGTSVLFSPPSHLAPPTDEDMVADLVPHPLDNAHNQSHNLKTELAGLNKREELLVSLA